MGRQVRDKVYCSSFVLSYSTGMKRTPLWLLLLTFVWTAVQILFHWLRLGQMPDTVGPLFYTVPMGAISAGFVLWLMRQAANHTTRVSTAVGYLVACPFALLGILAGGEAAAPLLPVTVLGAIPLILGAAAGYGLGKLATDAKRE